MNKFFMLFSLFSFSVWAQNQPQPMDSYELRGLYQLQSRTRPVEYVLSWKEKGGKVEGEYRDNYFAPSARVKGTAGELGRTFTVLLNEKIHGAKTLHLMTSMPDQKSGKRTLPVSVVVRDENGTPLSTFTSDARFALVPTNRIAQRQEEQAVCQQGMGELAGYCGVYQGIVSEDQDKTKSCDFSTMGTPQLELTQNGEIIIHLGNNPSIVTRPMHEVGRIPANIGNSEVDVMSRVCRPIPGVTFKGDDCKILNVRGLFSRTNGGNHFGGTYSIRNEANNRICIFQLSLDLRS